MDFTNLATILQNAKDGSEYLDYTIQRAIVGFSKPVPEYSRSLDAAMLLMPAGWTLHRLGQLSNCRGGFGGWQCDIYRASDAMLPYPMGGTAATAALALCLAIIRARSGEITVESGMPAHLAAETTRDAQSSRV